MDKNIGKDELFGALAKWSTVKDVATIQKMVPAGLNPDGYVSQESMKEILQWSKDKGLLKREIGMEEIVDNSTSTSPSRRLANTGSKVPWGLSEEG